MPPPSRATTGGGDEDVALISFLADVRAVGVLGADRLAVWADRALGIEPTQPQLVSARPGLLVDFRAVPLTLVARADFGEPARPLFELDAGAMVVVDSVVDDLYAWWRPSGAAQVIAGRQRVPFSRARLVEESAEPFGAPPFVIDRLAPDRRWGAALAGSWERLGYVAGAFADLDDLEPRQRFDDPSRGGAVAVAATVEWASPSFWPRGPLPVRRADPGFAIGQLAVSLGGLGRAREDGGVRLDGALGAQARWKALAAIGELLVSEDDGVDVGGHLTLLATPIDRLVLGLRGEWDPGAAGGGAWSAAANVGWHVTKDRRNRIAVTGWLKRDADRGTPGDGIVVFLQASL